EVRQAVRLHPLLLEQGAQLRCGIELLLSDMLSTQVCLLVREEVERELVPVLAKEPAREELVDVLERERVRSYEPRHVRAQSGRVAKPAQHRGCEVGTALRVGPVRLRLSEIVQKRAEAHRERRVRIGCRLNDGEDVVVERQMLAPAVLLEAERGLELREQGGEDAGVTREPQGPGGLAT